MIKGIISTGIILCFSLLAFSNDHKGAPRIKNFDTDQTGEIGKIWDIAALSNGILLMSADAGLVQYDGQNWKTYKGSIGFTRSILVKNDSIIFTGSDLDFGMWKKVNAFDYEYTSLFPFKDKIESIGEEFWNIYEQGEAIVFCSPISLYLYQNEQFVRVNMPTKIENSFTFNGRLYFVGDDNNVYLLDKFSVKKVDLPTNSIGRLVGMFSDGLDQYYVFKSKGIYKKVGDELISVSSNLSDQLSKNQLFFFDNYHDSLLLFGTISNGLIIANKSGELLHQLNKSKGLSNNTILCAHISKNRKLWVGMDIGLAQVPIMDNVSYFLDLAHGFGTASSAVLYEKDIFIGTNQGLYRKPWIQLNNALSSFDFNLVSNSEGQVWNLEECAGDLWVCHDKGLFLWEDELQHVYKSSGVWDVVKIENSLFIGTYNGVKVFKKINSKWTYSHALNGVLGSCNELIYHQGVLWIFIPNYAVLRVTLDKNLNIDTKQIFELSTFKGKVLGIEKEENDLVIYTDSLSYTYSHQGIRTFLEKEYPNDINLKRFAVKKWIKRKSLDTQYQFVPITNGFALINLEQNTKTAFQGELVLTSFFAYNSLSKDPILNLEEEIPYDKNNMGVSYIVPDFEFVEYRYSLDGKMWSKWSKNTQLELLGMSPGKYSVTIQAMLDNGEIAEKQFKFSIGSPFYLSKWAFAVYCLMGLLVLWILKKAHNLSIKKHQEKLRIEKELEFEMEKKQFRNEITLLERERLKNQNDELSSMLRAKTFELAAKAKANDDKNRLFFTLKEHIDELLKVPSLGKSNLKDIQRILESNLADENRTFDVQMEELHKDFFQKLKGSHPNLSRTDLKIAAYIKVGLNTKEIADMLNVQPSSAYINRSRLRKKLELDPNVDMYDFFNDL